MDLELSWEALFRRIAAAGTGAIVVIDEFPYLIRVNRALPSVFQRLVDLYLVDSGVKLFLCGSSVRMMESHVLAYRAPLYGRRTGQVHLRPLEFRCLREFFPGYDFPDLVRVYGACGGVPMYLREFDPGMSFWDNVRTRMLNPYALLYGEADLMLKQEFANLSTYKSILGAIASGRTRMDRIKAYLGAGKSDLNPYLRNLASLEVVKREVPVTEREERSRKGIYRIDDPYLDFFFRYIRPNRPMIEAGTPEGVLEAIRKDYDTYMGHIFERVAREAVLRWSHAAGRGWDRLGRWWQGEREIDIVGLSSARKEALFCEVKWAAGPAGPEVPQRLLEASRELRWRDRDRRETHLVVSRGGFTAPCRRLMEDEGIWGWDLKEIGAQLT
jgi:AAA+ ATPase superfamily predicted ATPase